MLRSVDVMDGRRFGFRADGAAPDTGKSVIQADVTGNATPELEIHLAGAVLLHAQDFNLT
jgi:hypothetical protein